MAHHRDPNTPRRLDAAAITAFEEKDEIKAMNQRIASLTSEISRKSQLHEQLAVERAQLYSKKAKCLEAWKKEFIQDWWHSAYDEYISENEFTERDRTSLFNIYKWYARASRRHLQYVIYSTFPDTGWDMVGVVTHEVSSAELGHQPPFPMIFQARGQV